MKRLETLIALFALALCLLPGCKSTIIGKMPEDWPDHAEEIFADKCLESALEARTDPQIDKGLLNGICGCVAQRLMDEYDPELLWEVEKVGSLHPQSKNIKATIKKEAQECVTLIGK